MISPWRRNLRLFVAYRAGISLLVYIPISLLFYQSMGLSLTQIGVLYAINALAILLFDVPTGFISDRIGYRRMLIVGMVVQAVCFGLLAINYWVWPVFVLQFVLGLGQAVARGADGPLLRISATSDAEFSRYSRRGVAAMGIAEGLASLAAVGLALCYPVTAPRIAMGVQALIYLAAVAIPYCMYETPPAIVTGARTSLPIRSVFVTVQRGLRDLFRTVRSEMSTNKEVRWLVFYGATIGCTTQTVVNLVQPYFQALHLATWEFALLWAGYHWLWAAFSLMSDWYERRLSRWGALASLVVWGVAVNAAMALLGGGWGLLAMTAFYFIRGIQMPIILDYMTGTAVPERRRGTLLAVQSSTQFAMYCVMNIVLGITIDYASVQAAFAVSLVVYGVLGAVFIWLLRHASAKTSSLWWCRGLSLQYGRPQILFFQTRVYY